MDAPTSPIVAAHPVDKHQMLVIAEDAAAINYITIANIIGLALNGLLLLHQFLSMDAIFVFIQQFVPDRAVLAAAMHTTTFFSFAILVYKYDEFLFDCIIKTRDLVTYAVAPILALIPVDIANEVHRANLGLMAGCVITACIITSELHARMAIVLCSYCCLTAVTYTTKVEVPMGTQAAAPVILAIEVPPTKDSPAEVATTPAAEIPVLEKKDYPVAPHLKHRAARQAAGLALPTPTVAPAAAAAPTPARQQPARRQQKQHQQQRPRGRGSRPLGPAPKTRAERPTAPGWGNIQQVIAASDAQSCAEKMAKLEATKDEARGVFRTTFIREDGTKEVVLTE